MTHPLSVAMKAGVLAGLAVLTTACSSQRFDSSPRYSTPPEQLRPVQSSTVQSSSLPPLGSSGAVAAGTQTDVYTGNDLYANSGDPALIGSTASLDGGASASGRDLSGGLTVAKLLGTWTVNSGVDQCRLNLTQTIKTGTSRYRASTPGCVIGGLAAVASWQLAGSQVQLFDEGGSLIGALLLSGGRFIGTLSGGQPITMQG